MQIWIDNHLSTLAQNPDSIVSTIFWTSMNLYLKCAYSSSQQFYAQNVLLYVGLLFSLVELQKVALFGPFFGKIEKEQSVCQSPPASAIKQLAGKYISNITHTRCNVTNNEPASNASYQLEKWLYSKW